MCLGHHLTLKLWLCFLCVPLFPDCFMNTEVTAHDQPPLTHHHALVPLYVII